MVFQKTEISKIKIFDSPIFSVFLVSYPLLVLPRGPARPPSPPEPLGALELVLAHQISMYNVWKNHRNFGIIFQIIGIFVRFQNSKIWKIFQIKKRYEGAY